MLAPSFSAMKQPGFHNAFLPSVPKETHPPSLLFSYSSFHLLLRLVSTESYNLSPLDFVTSCEFHALTGSWLKAGRKMTFLQTNNEENNLHSKLRARNPYDQQPLWGMWHVLYIATEKRRGKQSNHCLGCSELQEMGSDAYQAGWVLVSLSMKCWVDLGFIELCDLWTND